MRAPNNLRTRGSLTRAKARYPLTIVSIIIMMESSDGDIGQENLAKHGISYDQDVYTCGHKDDNISSNPRSTLPDHVDALREALLAFSNTILDYWRETLDDEVKQHGGMVPEQECLHPPDAAHFTSPRYELRSQGQQSTAANDNTLQCRAIAEAARKQANEIEDGWNHFYRAKFSAISMK